MIVRLAGGKNKPVSRLSVLELSIRNIRPKINPKKSRMQKRESRAKKNMVTAAFLAFQ
jgi:hypothetical protein